MESVPIYLANRFYYRIKELIRHWFVGSFFFISHRTLNILSALDRNLALKVTFRHWFKPLYQDYSAIGYGMAFVLRTARIFIASVLYLIVIVVAAVAYLIWVATPLYIIYRIF